MKFFMVALAVSLSVVPARAWDSGGHELIAMMAGDHLNPKARKAVDELAQQMSIPSQPYNGYTLACWMDDLRKNRELPDYGKFFSWHYIDLSIDDRDPVPPLEPGGDNIAHGNAVLGMKRALVVLQGGTDPYLTSKAMACAMMMHLVGDIHQPLHCASKFFYFHGELHNDAGGNKEDVINKPTPPDPKYNLHSFWDTSWRASFDEASGTVVLDKRFEWGAVHDPAVLRAMANELEKQTPPAETDLDPHFEQWARDGNKIARDFVYPDLTVTDNKKVCRLSSAYVAKANAIARQRLVLAAWRLARVLNETLGADAATPVPKSYPPGPPEPPPMQP